MAKCRMLYQENEELGRMVSSGRIAKLEGDLALQRNFSDTLMKSQAGEYKFCFCYGPDIRILGAWPP